jgi:hypothetical protein
MNHHLSNIHVSIRRERLIHLRDKKIHLITFFKPEKVQYVLLLLVRLFQSLLGGDILFLFEFVME